MYMYIISIYSNDTHQKNNILSLVKVIEKKKKKIQNVKSMSNLCRSWRRLYTIQIIQIYVNNIYYTLHTMIHIKRTKYFCLLNFF